MMLRGHPSLCSFHTNGIEIFFTDLAVRDCLIARQSSLGGAGRSAEVMGGSVKAPSCFAELSMTGSFSITGRTIQFLELLRSAKARVVRCVNGLLCEKIEEHVTNLDVFEGFVVATGFADAEDDEGAQRGFGD